MPRATSPRKERKTYTLSREAIQTIKAEMKERGAVSASSALEELLQERRRQKEMARVSASVSSYYDSLSDEDMKEQDRWGKFTESQFPLE